jgi:hypothetical protein
MTLTLTVFSLETGNVVDRITGASNAECERTMSDKWGTNDYGATYCEVEGDAVDLSQL